MVTEFSHNRMVVAGIGFIWGLIEPAMHIIGLCFAIVLIDCVTAWRLSVRVKKAYPNGCDGKFKSKHAKKMFGDMLVISLLVVVTYHIDMLNWCDIKIHNAIAGLYFAVELLSILENESSCNGSNWAKIMQKYVVDKTERHLNIDIDNDGKVGKDDE